MDFLAIGTDVELLAVNSKVTPPTVYGGRGVVTGGRSLPTVTYFEDEIGVDGHSATLELRPRQSPDARTLLYRIGLLVLQLDNALARQAPGMFLAAEPFILNEPLGGHLHVTVHLPETNDACLYEFVQSVLHPAFRPIEETLAANPDTGGVARRRRVNNPIFRNKGYIDSPRGRAFTWVEYRYPSTYLAHPALAATYIYAFRRIVEHGTTAKATKDTKNLERYHPLAAEYAANQSLHPKDVSPDAWRIDIPAWRQLVQEGVIK
jgi:hypothetical protein